ncbi:recombinase family protein [Arthrobacter sp. H5]|uniref:recombinase family protein n=1 Tax=Arthrobacter sp. H5 TaxID=1267973 RepID=UPI0004AD90C9
MATVGYMRVSTADQNTDGQRDALLVAGVKDDTRHLFKDQGVSGAKAERPGLTMCLDSLRQGDTLVVAKLDRLGRSLGNLIELVNALDERGVKFKALDNQAIDTTSNHGKLMLHIFGALAEYERGLIRERTNVGLEAARARGRKGGRPKLLDSKKIARAKELHSAGNMSAREIADAVGVSMATLYRYLSK